MEFPLIKTEKTCKEINLRERNEALKSERLKAEIPIKSLRNSYWLNDTGVQGGGSRVQI